MITKIKRDTKKNGMFAGNECIICSKYASKSC